jgi:nicotinamidase-related amidase
MHRHSHRLDAKSSLLVIVDVQEAFRLAIREFAQVAARIGLLARGAELLSVPVIITEQVPAKLGPTAPEILSVLERRPDSMQKSCFSACGANGFLDRLTTSRCRQAIVCGLETHICVNQTVHDLLSAGLQVHVVHDGVMSRTAADRDAALAKMLQSGAIPCSVEMALFEWLGDAAHEQFRAVQKLVK